MAGFVTAFAYGTKEAVPESRFAEATKVPR